MNSMEYLLWYIYIYLGDQNDYGLLSTIILLSYLKLLFLISFALWMHRERERLGKLRRFNYGESKEAKKTSAAAGASNDTSSVWALCLYACICDFSCMRLGFWYARLCVSICLCRSFARCREAVLGAMGGICLLVLCWALFSFVICRNKFGWFKPPGG